MITLLIAGQARVGKTTTASIINSLAKKRDFNPVILPFAAAIKEQAEQQGLTKDKNPDEYRAFCQSLGEGKRKENPDYWVERFKEKWLEYDAADRKASQCFDKLWKETVIIVDDCRYLNELNFGKTIGAKSLFISHGNRELVDANASWRNHESEHMANEYESGNKDYLDIFDFVIHNNKTLTKLSSKIENRIDYLLDINPKTYCDRCQCDPCKYFFSDTGPDIADLFED
jgi:hypothetical protein